ncbi:MAG TPA: DUF2252 domain-containing protein, partial [Chthoniobacterales bacterium]|nr:DUF2252 domain-containing protein [Chthoniobacterales bacterium]
MKPQVAKPRSERKAQGKALREKMSRAAHGGWKARSKSQDVIKLLEESDADRIPILIPVKYQRMAVSPFTFFRGSAIIQARDLAKTPVSGITVQACGDCHLANFGGFASPERTLVFDINDFDETFPGPWEWDLKRLGVSFVLAARDRGFSKSIATDSVRSAAASYRERMAEFAEMKVLDSHYAQINIDALKQHFRKDPDILARLSAKQKQARSQNSEAVIPKLTSVVNGHRTIKDNPPVIYHFQGNISDFEKRRLKFVEDYKKSLQPDRRKLYERYHYQDSAIKVVGIGSVGTRCYLSLLLADEDDPLFLQFKEARRSVLESPRGKSRYANQGFRVVEGLRLMQAASDIFLGWASSGGRDYYVRQFRDMKVSAEVETFKPRTLASYADMCGWALARAHAKSGDAAIIA